MVGLEIVSCAEVGEFSFRWPDSVEFFEAGWDYEIQVEGETHKVRHGIGSREVYGRLRLHTVTWLDGAPQVEGVEADDYPVSQALLSRLRRAGRANARTWAEVPAGYDEFTIVEHRVETDAPHSPKCLAVKIREDDLAGWALHGWLRTRLPRKEPAGAGAPVPARPRTTPVPLDAPPSADATAIADALLAHGATLASQLSGGAIFTPNVEANQLVSHDAFAFLIAVIADLASEPSGPGNCPSSSEGGSATSTRNGWPSTPDPSKTPFSNDRSCTDSSTSSPTGSRAPPRS